MPLGVEPQCAACKIYKSVMWRKGVNGETLCNSCHLKRVNSFLRSQRGTLKDSRRVSSSRLRPGRGKGSNGRHVERASKSAANRSRRTLFKQKVRLSDCKHSLIIDVMVDYCQHQGIQGIRLLYSTVDQNCSMEISITNWTKS